MSPSQEKNKAPSNKFLPCTNVEVKYNNNIEISRTNENIVFTGGLVIWKSTNGGSSWNQSTAYWPGDDDPSHPYVHPDHHCLKINPLDNKRKKSY